MEFRELKQSVEKIEMTDAMQNRIIRNCRYRLFMKRRKLS